MDEPKIDPVIIIGVLNWGLGHATRCVPIIRELEKCGFTTVMASDGAALDYLRTEFPHLPAEEIPAYGIHYSNRVGALLSVGLQFPKLWRAARLENSILQRLVERYRPVGIISDNRLGFYHPQLPSVYITHQLKLMLPFARELISSLHHHFIKRYDACWIPDNKGRQSLTGEMISSIDPGVPLYFLGPLSRFKRPVSDSGVKRFKTCVILSGPEPQRSILEKILWQQLRALSGEHLLIRGLNKPAQQLGHSPNVEVINFAGSEEIAHFIGQAELVISRSGYSSLMDYYYLGNRALLIPTPGQPEQEYLARYMLSRGWFYYAAQEALDLQKDVVQALEYPGFSGLPRKEKDLSDLFGLFEGKRKG